MPLNLLKFWKVNKHDKTATKNWKRYFEKTCRNGFDFQHKNLNEKYSIRKFL